MGWVASIVTGDVTDHFQLFEQVRPSAGALRGALSGGDGWPHYFSSPLQLLASPMLSKEDQESQGSGSGSQGSPLLPLLSTKSPPGEGSAHVVILVTSLVASGG